MAERDQRFNEVKLIINDWRRKENVIRQLEERVRVWKRNGKIKVYLKQRKKHWIAKTQCSRIAVERWTDFYWETKR